MEPGESEPRAVESAQPRAQFQSDRRRGIRAGERPISGIGMVPARERPRERLAMHGAAALSAAELIGVLWGSGTRGATAVDAASDALRRHEGLVGLAHATDVELEAVPGVGPVRAAQLAAAFELGRRVITDWPQGRWTVRAPRDVGERLVPQMGFLEREELRVVLMNTRNAVLRLVTVYQGNVSSSLVRVGELFRDAVRLNAAGMILVHNHPSGDPRRARTTSVSRQRRWPPGASWTSSCSITSSLQATASSPCATAESPSIAPRRSPARREVARGRPGGSRSSVGRSLRGARPSRPPRALGLASDPCATHAGILHGLPRVKAGGSTVPHP